MANVEMQLLSRVVRTGCLSEVLEWGMTSDDFRSTEGKGLFVSITGYWRAMDTQGSVPGPMLIKHYYPTFEFCDDPSMTTPALCSEVRRHRVAAETKVVMQETVEDIDIDPPGALATLINRLNILRDLGMKTNDAQFSNAIQEQWARYQNTKNGIGASSLFWPWEPFNEQTMGIQDDDYIVLYGRPKSMKSFVLSAMAAHSYDQGKHVLIYTKEMPAWQLFRRVAACVARLPYDEFRLGKLTQEDEYRFAQLVKMVHDQKIASNGRHNITCISGKDAPAGQDNMSWVRSKIDKYKPDIAFIDGLYLMSADGKPGKDHERVASISRAGRQMVLDTHVPLVATMQANRAAAKHANAELDEIAYSDAIGQDATCAIRVINEKVSPTLALVIAGSREFKLHGARIYGRPCEDFSFKEEMTEKEIENATRKDGDEKEGEKTKEKKEVKRNPSTKMNAASTPTSNVSEKIADEVGDIVGHRY